MASGEEAANQGKRTGSGEEARQTKESDRKAGRHIEVAVHEAACTQEIEREEGRKR